MPSSPGVICMAVYKPNSDLLRRQVASIQCQSLAEWNCMVGIDGADLRALSMLKEIIQDDERFQVHEYESRVGFYHNFERVLALVPEDAAWVALSDQDDVWHPHKLETLVAHLGGAGLVVGQARIVEMNSDGDGRKVIGQTRRSFTGLADLIFDNVVTGALTVFKPDLLQTALPFPARTDVSFHDHWLGLCAAVGKGIVFVPDIVQDYIQHSGNVIGEEKRSGLVARLDKLLSAATSLNAAASYLVNQRWRWRVQMCSVAMDRIDTFPGSAAKVLRAFAADRCSLSLLVMALRAALRGNCSPLRVAALLAGSMLAPIFPKETNNES